MKPMKPGMGGIIPALPTQIAGHFVCLVGNDKCAKCRAAKVTYAAYAAVIHVRAGLPWTAFAYGSADWKSLFEWRLDWYKYNLSLWIKHYGP
jgi:hypothetical protein